ncbi:hypothetical protein F4776DRAFT_669025 [Hypoxylon sp. NC0597]|nr:hypothetical protein F4776DRAFT_669025 [Hypoxylon sp. NC0597]
MAYAFPNNSCNPWSEPDVLCTLGNHAVYTLNATQVSHVQRGIKFAKCNNIRLVIRNTGHDYIGKCTGAHSLALWTHHMKSLELIEFESTNYKGPAIRMGTGVQAIEAYTFVNSHGLMVAGRLFPPVGIAGGYAQKEGGGHDPLASSYGLGVDQVLEWEVITADVTLITANSTHHSDLFWALRGGGGGTYGVMVSMTVKAFCVSVFWAVAPTGFVMTPAFVLGMHRRELDTLLQAALEAVRDLHLDYEYRSLESPAFLSAFSSLPVTGNTSDYNPGRRLVSRSLVMNNTKCLVKAIRIFSSQMLFTAISFNFRNGVLSPDEAAVNPSFRETLFDAFIRVPLNYTNRTENQATLDRISYDFLRPLRDLTPNGGAYLNEADT